MNAGDFRQVEMKRTGVLSPASKVLTDLFSAYHSCGKDKSMDGCHVN